MLPARTTPSSLTLRYRARSIHPAILFLFVVFLLFPLLAAGIGSVVAAIRGHAAVGSGFRGLGFIVLVLATIVGSRRTIVVDRAAGTLELRSLGNRQAFPLQDLRDVEVEPHGSLRRLVLVYGTGRIPLTPTFHYGVAHHEALARSIHAFLDPGDVSRAPRQPPA